MQCTFTRFQLTSSKERKSLGITIPLSKIHFAAEVAFHRGTISLGNFFLRELFPRGAFSPGKYFEGTLSRELF
jgi:hypothetical protein